jgi:arabinofuranan 3-O-arabinosyltransferase
VLVTVVFAVLRVRAVMNTPNVGSDLSNVYAAGVAALRGRSIYAVDPANPFVYPPTCALVAALVAKLMSLSTAKWLMAFAEFASILISGYAAVGLVVRSRWWPAIASVWLIVLLATQFTMLSAQLENLSMLLPVVAVLFYYLADADSWELAMLVLGLSMLTKPLLVPLFLIPLLAQKFRLTAATVGLIVVTILAAGLITGSAGDLSSVLHRLLSGSSLVGRQQSVYNVSLYGLSLRHGGKGLTDILRVLVVLMFVLAIWRARRRSADWGLRQYAGIGTLALLTSFLAGSLSEIHYLFSVFPGAIIVVVLTRSRVARASLIVATLVALLPGRLFPQGDLLDWRQAQLVIAQLVFFVGIWTDVTAEFESGPAHSGRTTVGGMPAYASNPPT